MRNNWAEFATLRSGADRHIPTLTDNCSVRFSTFDGDSDGTDGVGTLPHLIQRTLNAWMHDVACSLDDILRLFGNPVDRMPDRSNMVELVCAEKYGREFISAAC
jgi:hypothetical protein